MRAEQAHCAPDAGTSASGLATCCPDPGGWRCPKGSPGRLPAPPPPSPLIPRFWAGDHSLPIGRIRHFEPAATKSYQTKGGETIRLRACPRHG